MSIPGQSFVMNAISSNYGSVFFILKPFHERRGPELTGDAILARLRARLSSEVPEAQVLVFGPPAVRGQTLRACPDPSRSPMGSCRSTTAGSTCCAMSSASSKRKVSEAS